MTTIKDILNFILWDMVETVENLTYIEYRQTQRFKMQRLAYNMTGRGEYYG